MIYAEHVIGLRALERTRPDTPETAVAVQDRFQQIQESGALRARVSPKPVGEDGSTFELDRLAGDNRYVFMSHGPRYRELYPSHLCYGFIFDPKQLVVECGALVAPDLLEMYEDLLDKIVQEIDAELPPMPMTSDEEIAEFAGLFGEHDPEMLAYIQQQSTSRYWDIFEAVRDRDFTVEGAEAAHDRFLEQSARFQALLRKSGDEALSALWEMEYQAEILMLNDIPLKYAIGTIEAGVIRLK